MLIFSSETFVHKGDFSRVGHDCLVSWVYACIIYFYHEFSLFFNVSLIFNSTLKQRIPNILLSHFLLKLQIQHPLMPLSKVLNTSQWENHWRNRCKNLRQNSNNSICKCKLIIAKLIKDFPIVILIFFYHYAGHYDYWYRDQNNVNSHVGFGFVFQG